ncbi:AVAST type 4 anti-phage nuclease Avs4 [uncultured Roseivirga sp.]|uniref:AVAST type 4 anti-phage nuclease Avs4 n=1 Tax=uncultured Roseivirga sp. TaxID=543088 RepID=UPI000D7ABD97|nr:AVAST type 4 anti-phage nuclease Avs4 [uncultured Roseivirga sp.]PWL31747.1 MAG: hypothetical protein DCO95_00755 [Roseivirga sp. XM-24bin3]
MIEINWNVFKAKFPDREPKAFELLSYYLFCDEFEKPLGVFRFKNQTGVETDPIEYKGEIVGFQSKFYESKLSEHKTDLEDSITKAKRKNPELNKILFYLNQEFSESSKPGKKEPKYKSDVEAHAKKNGVSIVWKVTSHFEKQLSLPRNEYLSEHFFGGEGSGITDFLSSISNHTESILHSIQSDIKFRGDTLKIDRSELLNELLEEKGKSQVTILSGVGGCGKTALIKEFRALMQTVPFYVFKAAEFNIKQLDSLFGNFGKYGLVDFLEAHSNEAHKIIVIDSAEKLSDLEEIEPFREFLSSLLRDSWSIYVTTRDSYLEDLKFQFIQIYRVTCSLYSIKNIEQGMLFQLARRYEFEIPLDVKLIGLICNLFYLSEFLENYDSIESGTSYKNFRNIIWKKKIQGPFKVRNQHIKRENSFLQLIELRAANGRFFNNLDQSHDRPLEALAMEEVIEYDSANSGYFITHDIYEEWGLNFYLSRCFNSTQDYKSFFKEIGASLLVRRAFRYWVAEKIISEPEVFKSLILKAAFDEKLETFWKDEVLVTILLSNLSAHFFQVYKEALLQEDARLIRRITFLLRVACKQVDEKNYDLGLSIGYLFTKPKGPGWQEFICFLYNHRDNLSASLIPIIIPTLEEWVKHENKGETTRLVGLLGLHLYELSNNDREFKIPLNTSKKIPEIILASGYELVNEIREIISNILDKGSLRFREDYYDLCSLILTRNEVSMPVLNSLTKLVLQMADIFWFQNKELESEYPFGRYSGYGPEEKFSLSDDWHHKYFPASALQTPVYFLLKSDLDEGLQFILDFTAKTVQSAVESGYDSSIKQISVFQKDSTSKQFISHTLWQMYRGSGNPVTPYLLQSVHMALEKRLLEIANDQNPELLIDKLIHLLENTVSASISAVVASVVIANPEKLAVVAIRMLKTPDFLIHDRLRKHSEHQAKSLYEIGGVGLKDKIYRQERLKTCEDKHRELSLEDVVLTLQIFKDESMPEEVFQDRQEEIWSVLDDHYDQIIQTEDISSERINQLRLLVNSIDRRKQRMSFEDNQDSSYIKFVPQLEPELAKFQAKGQEEYSEKTKFMALRLWSLNKFEKDQDLDDYEQYENSPERVLSETKQLISEFENQDGFFELMNHSIPAYATAAVIKEYHDKINNEDKAFCLETIAGFATFPFQANYHAQISDGVEVAVSAIPHLIELFPEKSEDLTTILQFLLFNNQPLGEYKRICDYSIEAINQNASRLGQEFVEEVLTTFLLLKPSFNDFINQKRIEKGGHFRPISAGSYVDEFLEELEKSGPLKDFSWEALDIKKYDIEDLQISFALIRPDSVDEFSLRLVEELFKVIPQATLSDEDDNELKFSARLKIFKTYSRFILHRKPEEIEKFVVPFREPSFNREKFRIVYSRDYIGRRYTE